MNGKLNGSIPSWYWFPICAIFLQFLCQPTTSSTISRTATSFPNEENKFVIQWTKYVDGNDEHKLEFQAKIYPGGNIRFIYHNIQVEAKQAAKETGYPVIIGLQNGFVAKDKKTSKGEWSNWANGNFKGKANPTKFCGDGFDVIGMEWREQGGYGLVNLKFRCSDGLVFTMTTNSKGNWNRALVCDNGFDQTTAREQGGYGIVNVAVYGCSVIQYSNNNLNGQDDYTQSCPSGTKITGFETQEQGGYGIINYRFMCN